MIGSQSWEAEVAASSLLGKESLSGGFSVSSCAVSSSSPSTGSVFFRLAMSPRRGRMKFWSTARLNRNKFCQGVATRVGFQPWVADTVNKKYLTMSSLRWCPLLSLFCASVPMPRWRPCCLLIRARIGISGSVAKLMAWKMWRRMRGSATGQRELGTNTVGKGQRNFAVCFGLVCACVFLGLPIVSSVKELVRSKAVSCRRGHDGTRRKYPSRKLAFFTCTDLGRVRIFPAKEDVQNQWMAV